MCEGGGSGREIGEAGGEGGVLQDVGVGRGTRQNLWWERWAVSPLPLQLGETLPSQRLPSRDTAG